MLFGFQGSEDLISSDLQEYLVERLTDSRRTMFEDEYDAGNSMYEYLIDNLKSIHA